ncbi:phospholipase A and acyltransferase 5-like [Cololabis saira]|uniref:phospholipase A and acyltransferase 5-like n=1 Tax=Cololabis saira TaxID=129043 RepID=UPI002AD267D1|nr:phospholipase A and acyltransferase 5-like [Cololabis saira]
MPTWVLSSPVTDWRPVQGTLPSPDASWDRLQRPPRPSVEDSVCGKEVKPGDLIQIFRFGGLYQHWAVYVGDGDVVYLVPHGSGAVKGVVVKEKLEDVVKKDKWRVNNTLDNDYTPRPALVIVEKACKLVDTELQYDLKNYNCENFATEMRYGKPGNRQVKNVTPEAPVAGTTVIEKVLSWFFASSNSASSIRKYFDTEKKEIQPGDRIEIFRDGYQHWAVYVSDGDVVYLVTHESGAGTSVVVKDKLQDIVNKDFHRINNVLDDEYTPRSAKYILEKAVKMVDKKKKQRDAFQL